MSTWNDFVTAALIGSEKTAPPPLPSSIEATLAAAAEMDREIRFLTQAGALALYRRAGRKLSGNQTAIALAEPETTRRINAASTTFLRAMLGGRHLVLLPEWLGEAVRLSLHVPPQLLPALLDRARQDRALRPLVIGAGGRRAQWLAAHHPTWSFSVAESSECWETGSRDQRVALLRALRMSNPAEARSRVEAVWKTESADTRTAFITELLEGLSGDDLPFLEAALDDRSKEVRRVAIDLLARVPSAPFVTRMLERATPLLVYKPGKGAAPGSFEVLLPADPDAAGTRDGLDPKAFGAQKV
ncbi:MAG: DUF5691 domain-containing protein, partial [Verrucomicrobiota bacterium]